jgi:hypothetical protein
VPGCLFLLFAQQVEGQSLPIPEVKPGFRDNHILVPAGLLTLSHKSHN